MNTNCKKVILNRDDYQLIGKIRPRSTNEIRNSNWTLGCEVLDRDFADYEQYKKFIVPLGIKTIRLQGGWAKTEKVSGVYDFDWLDKVINDAISRGLNILLETDYGNPIYEGAGGYDLGAGFPTSEAGLTAWDKWVEAIAIHYKGRVRDWAMWNEPDINIKNTAESVVSLNIRTAEIIKRVIPDARIGGLSLAWIGGKRIAFWDECLRIIKEKNALHLFTWFIYHLYEVNPDDNSLPLEATKKLLKEYSSEIHLRQGESGCPSEEAHRFALSGVQWTEFSQAKWDLRRMLGDLGHDVESSIFTICDFNHIGREINRKGLIRGNADHSVVGPKQAYYSMQNLTSVFDDHWTRISTGKAAILYNKSLAFYHYQNKKNNAPLMVFWDCSERPAELAETSAAQVVLQETINNPVWVDLLSGNVYKIPETSIAKIKGMVVFKDVPIYDSPCLITDKDTLVISECK